MPSTDLPNLLAESGLPIAHAAVIGAPDGRPSVDGHDAAFRTTVRSLTVMQKEAIVVSTRSPVVWRLSSDEGPYFDGHDHAPAPLAYMTAGLVADLMNTVEAAFAPGPVLPRLRLTLDTYFSMQGSMTAGNMTGGAYSPDLLIEADEAMENIRPVVASVAAAGSTALMNRIHQSRFSLTTHGRPIDVGDVGRVTGPPPADPGGAAVAPPVDRDRTPGPVVEKTIDVEDKPPDAGVSLRETQDRRLHLRGISERRDDGVKVVEVWVFRPNGSTFQFLSDEPEGHGGHGRAPDAATLISAGLGFCFMTQIGRFAQIVDASLGRYHIVQDTRFSCGQAMTEPTMAGRASAPETHVYLEPDGDDELARRALAVSERTCFLHALCRTEVHPRIRFGRL